MAAHQCISCALCSHRELHTLYGIGAAHTIWEGFLSLKAPRDLSTLEGLMESTMKDSLSFLKDHQNIAIHHMKYYCYLKGMGDTDIQDAIDRFITTNDPLETLMRNEIETTSFLRKAILLLAERALSGSNHRCTILMELALTEILWIHLYIPNKWETPEDEHIPEIIRFLEGLDKDLLAGVMGRSRGGRVMEIRSFLEDFTPADYFKENTMDLMKDLKNMKLPEESDDESDESDESDY